MSRLPRFSVLEKPHLETLVVSDQCLSCDDVWYFVAASRCRGSMFEIDTFARDNHVQISQL